jgi:uncharacterized membrane protein YtjA (UPF0391 family)
MLMWSLTFFIVALVAGILGFTNIAKAASGIAKLMFYIFVALFVGSLIMHII